MAFGDDVFWAVDGLYVTLRDVERAKALRDSRGKHGPTWDNLSQPMKDEWIRKARRAPPIEPPCNGQVPRPHSHYYKDVRHLDHVDVYRVLDLFNVTDPCLQHAVKKLLVAGGRGGGKDITQDIKEAVASLTRWQAMREEDNHA